MTEQLTIFTGKELKSAGMALAIESANNKSNGWSEKAFEFLEGFIKSNRTFLAEDLRNSSTGVIEDPPSLRAWGGIMARACKKGLIKRIGFENVKNVKAHCTPATLWQSTYFK